MDRARVQAAVGSEVACREVVEALNEAGVPAVVTIQDDMLSEHLADRVRWLAAQRGQKSEG